MLVEISLLAMGMNVSPLSFQIFQVFYAVSPEISFRFFPSHHRLHLRNLLSGTVELGPNVALAEPAIQQALVQAFRGFRLEHSVVAGLLMMLMTLLSDQRLPWKQKVDQRL